MPPSMNTAPDILIVEDIPSDAELVTLAHKSNNSGSTLHIVRDGLEALTYLLGDADALPCMPQGLPQLVLLDLHSPRLSGLEALKRLRADERTRALRIVVFSSSEEPSDVAESHRLGADDYVRKPAGFKQLRQVLMQLERDWLKPGLAQAKQVAELANGLNARAD